jgi:hypothetical protein
MAKRNQIVEALAPVVGLNLVTLDGIDRRLAPHGLVSQVGRGQRAEHYTAEHIKNVLLAASALQPIQAPETVFALNQLHAKPPNALLSIPDNPLSTAVPPGTLFGEWVKGRIERLATHTEERQAIFDSLASHPPLLRIRMSPATSEAFVSELVPGVGQSMVMFGPDPKLFPADMHQARRVLEITEYALAVAAELLADSWAKQATQPTPKSPSGRGDKGAADPEKQKAAGTGIHNGLRLHQPFRIREKTALVNEVQFTEKEGTGQPSSSGSDPDPLAGVSFTIERRFLKWPASDLHELPSGSPRTPASQHRRTVVCGTQP